MNLFTELKRRNVFKVGASYAIVSWIVLQVADTAFPRLNIPDWAVSFLLVLLLLGFPLALFLAWAYEMTPEGIKPTKEVSPEDSIRAQTGQKMNYLVVGGLVVLLAVVVLDAYVFSDADSADVPAGAVASTEQTPTAPPADTAPAESTIENSIAVLPFTNLSDDPAQDYFSDGLSEELINKLSQVQQLLVIGRNSSFYFKGRDEDLLEIGKMLDVSYILQGSVRKSGEKLRVTAQLMDARNGFNLWSETFDREIADVFAIQDEISREVTTNLSVSLGVGEFDREGMTRNLAAYDAYLKALQVFNDNEASATGQAVEYLQEAVSLDPDFALAWSELQYGYWLARAFAPGDEREGLTRQMDAARQRAVDLAPRLPEMMSTEALDAAFNRNDWIEADRLFQELLAQYGDSNSVVNASYGGFLFRAGKSTEALAYFQRARRLDPLGADVSINIGIQLLALGRVDEAIAEAERGLANEATANFVFLDAVKKVGAYVNGDYTRAIELLKEKSPGEFEYDVELPLVELLAEGKSMEVATRIRAIDRQTLPGVAFVILGPVAALAGDGELAASFMTQVPGGIGYWAPFSRPVFNEPAMKQDLQERGLVDYWRVSGWNDFCKPLAGNDDFECF